MLENLFSIGFRPFFLAAAWFSVLWIGFWISHLSAGLSMSGFIPPGLRHGHEMLYGFAMAVLAGFLLTAAQNWTGLCTTTRHRLAILFSVWLLARLGFALPETIPLFITSALDLIFLPLLAVTVGRVLVQAGSRRNYVFIPLLAAFWLLDLTVHLHLHGLPVGDAYKAMDVSVLLLVTLLAFMGGRVIPFFTANRLPEAAPRQWSWLNWGSTLAVAALLPIYLAAGRQSLLFPVLLAAAALIFIRQLGWRPWLAVKVPMLWILHLGYLWIPAGLVLLALHLVTPTVPWSAGVHALMTGAMGSLILGMMARVALGHTGRPIIASCALSGAFLSITLAAAVRVAAAFPGTPARLLPAAGVLWCAAFLIYALQFTPILLKPRTDAT